MAALVDIPRTGDKLRGKIQRRESQQVIFRTENIQVAAEVVRQAHDTCAVEFETPIAVAEVKRLREQVFKG